MVKRKNLILKLKAARFLLLILILIYCPKFNSSTLYGQSIPILTTKLRSNANLRSEPALNASIITVLNSGTLVQIFSKLGEWYYITSSNGVKGWINQVVIESININPISRDNWILYVTPLLLEPQQDAQSLTKIFPFQKFDIISQNDSWLQVSSQDIIGWIYNKTSAEQLSQEKFSYGTFRIIKSGNVRLYPDLEAPVLGKVSEGQEIKIVGIWKEWYHCIIDNSLGYIHSILIRSDSFKPLNYQFVKVIKEGNIRKYPNYGAKIIGQTKIGQEGYLLEKSREWNLVYIPFFTIGWINDVLLEMTEQPGKMMTELNYPYLETLLKGAQEERIKKNYYDAFKYYLELKQTAEKLYQKNPGDDCILYYYVAAEYALSEQLFYPLSQITNPIVKKIQTVSFSAPCNQKIEELTKNWEKGFEFRNKVLALSTSRGTTKVDTVENTLQVNPVILPLLFEAEAKRYIARYYNQIKNQKQVGLQWLKESVAIYKLFYHNGLLKTASSLAPYFDSLMELSQNYYELKNIPASMAVLDEVSSFLKSNHREDWYERYLKMVDQVTLTR